MDTDEFVQPVRAAIEDRALYLALLLRRFSTALPAGQVEALGRKAIFEYGRLRGARDKTPVTPDVWVDGHVSKGSAKVFESRVVKAADHCEQQMTFCPLVNAWKRLGCTPEEIDWLCDIAMEVDRGRADYHGLHLDISKRLAHGDPFCCLILSEMTSTEEAV